MDSLDGSFDGSDDGNIECLLLGFLMRYTDGKALGSDKGIKLGSTDDKVLGTILGNIYGMTLGLDIGKELGF